MPATSTGGRAPLPSAPPVSGQPRIAPLPSLMEADEASEMRLDALLRDPSLGILLTGEDRRVIHASDGLCRMWGVPISRVVGQVRDDFLAGLADRFEEPVAFQKEMGTLPKGPFVAFATLRLRDGRRARWQARPLVLPQGVWHMETFRIEG